jgi:electron transfer flavoprotein alpha subunit
VRIAALVKQIPEFEQMVLGPDGRLVRDGLPLEMNAYCRRAVAKGVELARATNGTCTVFTLGPPSAEDTLREAIAWGADEGVLITDPVFAGSDTLATARALAAALEREAPFDLILLGRNSVDADTGQVPPELAQLLDLPFATGVRELELGEGVVRVGCEHDDEWVEKVVTLPAVLSTAERLCDPCKQPPEARAAVDPTRMRTLRAGDLGPGPWGQHGSPTRVGAVRVMEIVRAGHRLEGPVAEQVDEAVRLLQGRGALDPVAARVEGEPVPGRIDDPTPAIGVVLERGRPRLTGELLGAAARLAVEIDGRVVALGVDPGDDEALGGAGADAVIELIGGHDGGPVEEDVAAAVAGWAEEVTPWALLAPGTPWGREVAARVAAAIDAGLTGDAVELDVEDGRLVGWKPAFGGRTVAAIHCSSPVQMATVRPGVLPVPARRDAPPPPRSVRRLVPRGRVTVTASRRDDDSELMVLAPRVIGIGKGVDPERYGELEGLRSLLGAELAATRKVTDEGWMPRARQVGITGHAIAPRLFISLGASGKFNHTVGVRQAGTVLAVNPDPDAPIWAWCDVGITATWEEVVPLLEQRLAEVLGPRDRPRERTV